jgi:hypothetical protein
MGSSLSPKLVGWVEETLTFYRLPRQHHKHLKSTNMLERLNEEIKRRTHVVHIFPSPDACRRLIRALAVETHENWLEAHRYLKMNDLRALGHLEQLKRDWPLSIVGTTKSGSGGLASQQRPSHRPLISSHRRGVAQTMPTIPGASHEQPTLSFEV